LYEFGNFSGGLQFARAHYFSRKSQQISNLSGLVTFGQRQAEYFAILVS